MHNAPKRIETLRGKTSILASALKLRGFFIQAHSELCFREISSKRKLPVLIIERKRVGKSEHNVVHAKKAVGRLGVFLGHDDILPP